MLSSATPPSSLTECKLLSTEGTLSAPCKTRDAAPVEAEFSMFSLLDSVASDSPKGVREKCSLLLMWARFDSVSGADRKLNNEFSDNCSSSLR